MVKIGYHASHEQFTPSELLTYAVAAERAGFASVMSSDHLAPWSQRQGQSGFVWTWLGAAMQATSIPFGLITVPTGFRYGASGGDTCPTLPRPVSVDGGG